MLHFVRVWLRTLGGSILLEDAVFHSRFEINTLRYPREPLKAISSVKSDLCKKDILIYKVRSRGTSSKQAAMPQRPFHPRVSPRMIDIDTTLSLSLAHVTMRRHMPPPPLLSFSLEPIRKLESYINLLRKQLFANLQRRLLPCHWQHLRWGCCYLYMHVHQLD